MVGIVLGHLQRRTSCQQSHPNLPPSADVGGERHGLSVRRQRREFSHAHKVGKPPPLCWRRTLHPRLESSRQESKTRRPYECQRTQKRDPPASTLPCREGHRRSASCFLAAEQFQIECQVARRLKSFRRILFQASINDAPQCRRKTAPAGRKFGGLLLEDCAHGICGRLPLKCLFSAEHLVQNRAQAEDIGATVDDLSAHLLW